MNYYSRQYKTTQIATANPRRLLLYLYDAAISHIHDAAADLQGARHAACGQHLGAAMDIVIELATALDYEQSPRLAARLSSLYNFLIENLAIAQKNADLKMLRACEGILTTLAAAWRHAVAADQASSTPASAKDTEDSVALAV